MEAKRYISDNTLYDSVQFRVETLKFYVEAFGFYKKLLEDEFAAIRKDDFLQLLFKEGELQRLPLTQELAEVEKYTQVLQKKIEISGWKPVSPDAPPDIGFRELNLTHRSIRYIKSVVELYLQYLKVGRDTFIRSRKMPRALLQAIDTKIVRLSENNRGGVFEDAELIPLLVDYPEQISQNEETQTEQKTSVSPTAYPLPTPIYGIEILDIELRDRCVDLLEQFSNSPTDQRLDLIISEATRILENRIRSLPGVDPNSKDPISVAFGGNNPVMQISNHPAEREGAFFLFKGIFQFIRNPFHHRIIPIDREGAVQLLGMVDYLLYLIDNASRTIASP